MKKFVKGTRKQNADSTYNLRIPLAICGFNLQLRIPQQVNLTIQTVLIPQIQLRIPQIRLFFERFWAVQWFRYLFVESKRA